MVIVLVGAVTAFCDLQAFAPDHGFAAANDSGLAVASVSLTIGEDDVRPPLANGTTLPPLFDLTKGVAGVRVGQRVLSARNSVHDVMLQDLQVSSPSQLLLYL